MGLSLVMERCQALRLGSQGGTALEEWEGRASSSEGAQLHVWSLQGVTGYLLAQQSVNLCHSNPLNVLLL